MKYKKAFDAITVTPIAVTMPLLDEIPGPDGLISYQARVSNEKNQLNFSTADKLLAHCAEQGHWSVFDMVDITFKIEAPRDISRQILRHYSMRFQEFSQRYADVEEEKFVIRELRMQDNKNRQNSLDCFDVGLCNEWEEDQRFLLDCVRDLQEKWRGRGAAKEVVRCLFPEGLTMSSMFAKVPVRTLTHYLKSRLDYATQKEHRYVATLMALHVPSILPEASKYLVPECN